MTSTPFFAMFDHCSDGEVALLVQSDSIEIDSIGVEHNLGLQIQQ